MKLLKSVSLHSIYARIVFAALAAHISYAVLFGVLKIFPMLYYNLFSILFYTIVSFIIHKKMYRLAVTSVHLEVCLFVTISVYYMGWNQGYAFYLIALCALVYFCPFQNVYIPYLFSFAEILLFILLKIHSTNCFPAMRNTPAMDTILYCYNACAGFLIILYGAFITRLSSLFMNRELLEKNSKLQKIVDHDTLTQLSSRSYIEKQLNQINGLPGEVSIAMADIDDFKQINDTYGHPCGDFVLSTLSTIMKTICPADTVVGRWGGEEFILIFYGLPANAVNKILEQIRRTIQSYVFQYESNRIRLTLTFGLSSNGESKDGSELVRIADNRLYQGKRTGKNKVVSHDA